MPAIDVSTFLQPGAQYTFSFQQSGFNPIRAGVADVTAALQYVAGVSNPSVRLVGGVLGLFANQYDLTFTYQGDNSTVAADLIQPMLVALDDLETLASFDFLGASGGASGVAPNTTLASSPLSSLALPSTSGMWALAVVVLLLVFLMSGGASVVRRVTA